MSNPVDMDMLLEADPGLDYLWEPAPVVDQSLPEKNDRGRPSTSEQRLKSYSENRGQQLVGLIVLRPQEKDLFSYTTTAEMIQRVRVILEPHKDDVKASVDEYSTKAIVHIICARLLAVELMEAHPELFELTTPNGAQIKAL